MKRILSFVMICILLFSSINVYASELNNEMVSVEESAEEYTEEQEVGPVAVHDYDDLLDLEITVVDIDEIEQEIYDAEELLEMEENAHSVMSEIYGSSWNVYSNYYIYNRLSEDGKKLWSALEVLCAGYLENEVTLEQGLTDYVEVKITELDQEELLFIIQSFRYSNPQYYYLMSSASYGWSDTSVVVAFGVYDAFVDGTARKEATEQIQTQLEAWYEEIALCTGKEEKILKIHDLICNKVDYNYDAAEAGISAVEQEEFTQSAYSVLCKDETVCAGYTMAFTWLCNGTGIETYGVTSSDHAWNKIKVNDSWYNVDCTWDDGDDGVKYYQYYLRNDAFYDTLTSHAELDMWTGYLPVCTLDSGSTYYAVGSLPEVTQRVEAPHINVSRGETSYIIEITTGTEGASIYYTLDGRVPSESASKGSFYTGEFETNATGAVRAIAVCNGYWDSEIAEGDSMEEFVYTIASGECGENITWQLDSTGCLALSGTGEMSDYPNADAQPWAAYRADITEVKIGSGITAIGDYALAGFRRVSAIELPDSVAVLGKGAFYSSTGLENVILPENLTSIGAYAFGHCEKLKEITIPETVVRISSEAFESTTKIIGYSGSAAQTFAEKNGNEFIDINQIGIKVEFITNTDQMIPDKYYLEGNRIKEPVLSPRTGYSFGGWYISSEIQDKTTLWDFGNDVIVEPITLYAKWIPDTYKLAFDLNYEGAESLETMNVTYDAAYGSLPEVSRVGYTFEGWYSDAEEGDAVTSESIYTITGDSTLYAHWTPNSYVVTLDAAGGTVETGEVTVIYDTTYGMLPIPVREGYTFKGWYAEVSGGVQVEDTTIVEITEAQTLYAQWAVNEYEVTFDPKGGTVEEETRKVTFDAFYGELPMPVREGYTFAGWELEDGTAVTAGSQVSVAENHTLGAKWTGNIYTITFAENDGYIESNSLTVQYGNKYGELPVPVREGYSFDGWHTAEEILITAENIVEIVGDHTLYASYTPNAYEIFFDANGGITDVAEKLVTYDQNYGELPVPVLQGRIFLGWYTEEDVQVTADTVVDILDHQTLYAHWEFKYTAEPVVASVLTGSEVEAGTRVSLSTQTNGAQIYYTTDAEIGINVSEQTGVLYEDAFKITQDITIYAIAIKEGYNSSPVQTVTYTVKDESQDWGDITEQDRAAKGFLSTSDVPDGLWVAGVSDCEYKGKAITFPELHIYNHKQLLQEKADYTVKYTQNTNVGTGTITVTGKGNYTGSIVATFDILPIDMSNAVVLDVKVPYTGKVQKAATSVTCLLAGQVVTLKSGKDFAYTYPGTNSKEQDYDSNAFKEVGDYTVTLTGKGNYAGTTSFTQTITGKYAISKMKLTKIANQKYTGSAVTPTVVLKNGAASLVENEDFTVSYSNNTEVGTATVTITGMGDYTGVRETSFKITGTALSKIKLIGFRSTLPWTGETVTQDVSFSYTVGSGANSTTEYLIEGKDYEVSYLNNTEVGTATVIFTGIGGYTGTVKKTYKITGNAISKAIVSGLESTMIYNVGENRQTDYQLTYTVKNDGIVQTVSLVEGQDYTVSYRNNQKAGKASIVFSGMGGYTGTLTKSFTIKAYDLSAEEGKITVSEIKDQPYIKGGVSPKPMVTYTDGNTEVVLVEGKDYTLKYTNNKALADKGIVKAPTVTITGKGNFKGKVTQTFSVVGSNLAVTTMTAKDVVYQNKAGICKPIISLLDVNGKKLAAGTDYDKNIVYTYAKDVEVTQVVKKQAVRIVREQGEVVDKKDIIPVGAEIVATVTGIKSYEGTKSVTFRYVAGDMSKATIKVSAQVYTGKAVEPTKNDITVKIGKAVLAKTDYEIVSYSNNIAKGKAKVTIRGIGNYGGEKTVTFQINSKTMNYTIIYDKNAMNATGTMKTTVISAGKKLTSNAYKRTGYTFVGWNTEPDGSGISYTNKEAFYLKASQVYGMQIRLYAQWEEK